MLYLIGLGIYDEKDMSLRALEILRDADYVYSEFYTNAFTGDIRNLERLIGKKIQTLNRSDLEEHPEENILKNPSKKTTLLIPGDPMVATTHTDLILRAKESGIEVKIIHSSSIYSAIAETGLHIYKFGKTTSLPFPQKNYFPTSPYTALKDNLRSGMHTLFLLDVRAQEDRYMTINDAIQIMHQIEESKKEKIFTKDTLCVGVARLGGDSTIIYGKTKDLMDYDFGRTPHSLVVPGKLHFIEEEMLQTFTHK